MQLNDQSDLKLLQVLSQPFGADGRAALAELYRRHSAGVRGLLERFSGVDAAAVEDCVQETFLMAKRQAARFERGSALPWLLAIAMHRVRERRRSDRRRSAREAEAVRARAREQALAADAPEPNGEAVEELLASLPERDRVLLELRFVQDLSFGEVAAALGVSVRTAKSWSSQALARLRAMHEDGTAVSQEREVNP